MDRILKVSLYCSVALIVATTVKFIFEPDLFQPVTSCAELERNIQNPNLQQRPTKLLIQPDLRDLWGHRAIKFAMPNVDKLYLAEVPPARYQTVLDLATKYKVRKVAVCLDCTPFIEAIVILLGYSVLFAMLKLRCKKSSA